MSVAPAAVTVVVPACDVGRYLRDCLDSVLAQTLRPECPVIVVDDGSTDDTGAIADAYADHCPRVTVVHQPNAGPGAGAARNRGLDLVRTEFVLFLDGDDELTPRALETMQEWLVTSGLDLAVGATEQFPEPRRWIWSPYFEAGESRPTAIEEVPLLVHDARTCNRLYRTSWLRSLGLRFAEGIHHQDTVVNVPAILLAERFVLVGDTVHRYRKRAEGGSVMDNHYTRVANFWDHLHVIEELQAMRPRLGPTREPLMQAFIARSFQGFSWRAPAALPPQRLPEFFDRAAAVISTIEPAIIEWATRGAPERTAYVTMLDGDFAAFERLDEVAGRLEAHGGHLHLGVPAAPEHRSLLRTGATKGVVTGLTSDAAGVRLRIRLRIRDTVSPPAHSLSRTRVRALVDGEVRFSTDVTWTASDGTESVGEALVPWSRLKEGEYQLRLHYSTPTGTAARWLRLPIEGRENPPATDPVRHRLVRVTLDAGDDGRAVLIVRPSALRKAGAALAVLRHRMSRVGG